MICSIRQAIGLITRFVGPRPATIPTSAFTLLVWAGQIAWASPSEASRQTGSSDTTAQAFPITRRILVRKPLPANLHRYVTQVKTPPKARVSSRARQKDLDLARACDEVIYVLARNPIRTALGQRLAGFALEHALPSLVGAGLCLDSSDTLVCIQASQGIDSMLADGVEILLSVGAVELDTIQILGKPNVFDFEAPISSADSAMYVAEGWPVRTTRPARIDLQVSIVTKDGGSSHSQSVPELTYKLLAALAPLEQHLRQFEASSGQRRMAPTTDPFRFAYSLMRPYLTGSGK